MTLKSFTPQTAPRTGRVKGARNRLSARFLEDLLEVYEELGKPALFRLAKRKNPEIFCKLIAYVLPKEFEITDSRLKELSDEQLDQLIAIVNGRIADRTIELTGREESTLN